MADKTTVDLLVEQYGMTLSTEDMCDAIGRPVSYGYQRFARGDFPIPTFVDGRRRVADVRDVAAFIDQRRRASR